MLGLTGVTMSQAAVGNPFDIDGLVIPDSPTGWVDDGSGGDQELGPLNSNTTKLGVIHTAATPMLGTTNPNAQVDLREVWVTSQSDDAGDIWLYFAWHRDSNKGSGVLMYEFQAQPLDVECDYSGTDAALIADCNPWANRQPGDFIIVWDQSGNAANILLRTWYYLDADGNPSTDLDGWTTQPLLLDAGEDLDANGDAFAAYSGDRFMGEAAVNLSNTVFPENPTSCRTIANIIPGTVTGNSDTADYKDTVLGDFVDISNCGSVTITKDTNPEAGTGEFQYTLSRTGDAQIRFDGTLQAQHTLTEDGDFNTETNLVAGSGYTLSEDILDGPYDLLSIVCDGKDMATLTFDVVANTTKQCLITNELQQGTLIVEKVVTNDDGGELAATDFSFSIDGAAAVPFDADGSVSTTVDAGTYAVTEPEANSRGYSTTYAYGTSTSCSAVVVPAGGSATCTITNDDQAGSLTVTKVVTNDDGGTKTVEDFSFSIDGGTAVAFDADGSVTTPVDAGTYAVTEPEANSDGYTTSYLDSAGGSCGAIVVPLGGSATCTITNDDQPGTLIVTKVLTQDNGRTETVEDFSYTIDGGSSVAFEADGSNSHTVDAGTYDVVEDTAAGYTTSYSDSTGDACLDIVIPNGGTETCTITNDDEKASPTGTTVQSWVLHDDLTIAGLREGATDAEDATATFRLYADASCGTQVGDDEVVDLTGSAAGTTIGVMVTESGDYFWRVSYSGDQFNDPFTTGCGDEITDIRALDAYEEGRNDFE